MYVYVYVCFPEFSDHKCWAHGPNPKNLTNLKSASMKTSETKKTVSASHKTIETAAGRCAGVSDQQLVVVNPFENGVTA